MWGRMNSMLRTTGSYIICWFDRYNHRFSLFIINKSIWHILVILVVIATVVSGNFVRASLLLILTIVIHFEQYYFLIHHLMPVSRVMPLHWLICREDIVLTSFSFRSYQDSFWTSVRFSYWQLHRFEFCLNSIKSASFTHSDVCMISVYIF